MTIIDAGTTTTTQKRKRPLLPGPSSLSASNQKLPPPKTETTLRLEKLLDDQSKKSSKKKKKKKRIHSSSSIRTTESVAASSSNNNNNNRFAYLATANTNNDNKDVLKSRGGLASASTFLLKKKKKNPVLGGSSSSSSSNSNSKKKENEKPEDESSSSKRRKTATKGSFILSKTFHNTKPIIPSTRSIGTKPSSIFNIRKEEKERERQFETTKNTSSTDQIPHTLGNNNVSSSDTITTSVSVPSTTQIDADDDSPAVQSSSSTNPLPLPLLPPPTTTTTDVSKITKSPSSSSSSSALDNSNLMTTTMAPKNNTNVSMKLSIGNKKRRRIIAEAAVTNTRRPPLMMPEEDVCKLPAIGREENLKLKAPPCNRTTTSGDDEEPKEDRPENDGKLLQSTIGIVRQPSSKQDSIFGNGTTTTATRGRMVIEAPSKKKLATVVNNDNFVRQNLKNSAGACRGARNKKRFRGGRRFSHHPNDEEEQERHKQNRENKKYTTSQTSASYTSKMTGLDPLDEFLDGEYSQDNNMGSTKTKTQKANSATDTNNNNKKPSRKQQDGCHPLCARHQRPCKLITVKKNTSGNKGRKFYACSMPRGEQCDHFQWAEDTIEAAKAIISKNTSHSNFIARQVTAHVNRFRPLTVPELREELVKRKLDKNGKKQQLLMRLAIWTRDEIAQTCAEEKVEIATKKEIETVSTTDAKQQQQQQQQKANLDEILGESDNDTDDSDGDSSVSTAELEIFPAANQNQGDKRNPDDEDIAFDSDEDSDDDDIEKDDKPTVISEPETPLDFLQAVFGHSKFRDGQEWAIGRSLDMKKSILVAPTGFGKSLCYALPAAMMDGVCVVVSPLISLIEDQLRSLPPRVPAATLSGSISASSMAAIIDDIIRKRIKILFVSPERLTSPSFRRLFNLRWNDETKQMERRFPDISLLCVDEAHCMSQWAHNFRPCFLRFKNLLSVMTPKSVLAITATAGPKVLDDICDTLSIDRRENDEDGDDVSSGSEATTPEGNNESIKIINKSRDNIDVACHFVGSHEERLSILASILKSKSKQDSSSERSCKFSGIMSKGSVIVYVWRQKDTEVVGEYLQSSGVSGGVVTYHGGMDTTSRSKAQSKFMRGKARICVATVAFGLGIDKADIEGIVHMYISNSPEHYLQEIGRAGRDGRQARALALPVVDEIPLRHSLPHSNLISKSQIKSLLYALQQEVKLTLAKLPEGCDMQRPLYIGLPILASVTGCDCKVETLDTLLSLIERGGGADPLLNVEGFNYDRATIAMKKRKLEKLASKEEVAKSILSVAECLERPVDDSRQLNGSVEQQTYPTSSFQRQFIAYSMGSYTFSVASCAGHMGPKAEPRHVFAALKRLQSMNELEFLLDTTDAGRVLNVRLSQRGVGFFTNENFENLSNELVDDLHRSVSSSIVSGADKVLDMHLIMQEVSAAGKTSPTTNLFQNSNKSQCLVKFQELVKEYFEEGFKERQKSDSSQGFLPDSFSTISKQQLLENDVYSVFRDLPCMAKQATGCWQSLKIGDSDVIDYTALSISKFLHGLDSPRAPALACRGHALFGKWKDARFAVVLEKVKSLLETEQS